MNETSLLFLMPISIIIFVFVSILTTVLFTVWTYKDSKKRNMDTTMWTVLAIFIPYGIGVIVYLVARKKNPAFVCPNCGESINGHQLRCFKCGIVLKRQCPQCGVICEDTWNACPRCSSLIQTPEYPIAKPRETTDHMVRNVVILLVANVIAFFGYIGAIAFSAVVLERNDRYYYEEYGEFGKYEDNSLLDELSFATEKMKRLQ